jgi:flagellar hook-associated protein 2
MSSVSSTGSSSAASALSSTSAATQILNNLNANGLAFSGLASGLDTSSIIQSLQQLGQQQVTNLQNQISTVTGQETAFKALDADLLALQAQADSLSSTTNGVFDANTATVSDPTLVSAAASGSAIPGVYNFTVNSLAQSQEIASQGYTSSTSTIAQGTYSIQVGSGSSTTISVDGTNDTVQQFVNAINDSQNDVTATLVNTSSSTTNPSYRILLAANEPGADNTINVSYTASSSPGSGSQAIFNNNYIDAAVASAGNTSTAGVTSNSGAGSYLGSTDNTYTFTVSSINGNPNTTSGTVGTDTITLNVTDSAGDTLQQITLPTGASANSPQNVLLENGGHTGVQITVGSGTLSKGDTFTVNTFVPTVQAAEDSSITLGSGPGALTITNSSNVVNGVIPGVTLNLLSANPSSPVSVTVAPNTANATSAINNLVSTYNQFINDVATDTAYNTTTQTGGVLLGNVQLASIQQEVESSLNAIVPGLGNQGNSLDALGISVNSDGTLSVDSTTLANALSGETGLTNADFKQLFGLTGQSTNSGVQFLSGSNSTVASTTPYLVKITQAATQGSLTGSALAPSTLIPITSGANTLTVTANGVSSQTITLTPNATGYTPQQLAQILQNQINADPNIGNGAVSVVLNSSNQIQLTSELYGSHSTVSVSGTALSSLGLNGAPTVDGQDVAGSFTADGVTEQATGIGQILTGNSGNPNTSGLSVEVTLTPSQVGSGSTTNLTITRGLASSLSLTLSNLTDSTSGTFQSIDAGYQAQITSLNTQITSDNTLLQQQQDALTAQFANLEQIISTLKENSQVISSLTPNAAAISAAATNSSSSSSSSGSNTTL